MAKTLTKVDITTTRTRHINCPVCGAEIPITHSSGRKPLNLSVNLICDTLKRTHSIKDAAEELGCSRAYIYKVLKTQKTTLDEILNGKTENGTPNQH
jgi:hypothetical protein